MAKKLGLLSLVLCMALGLCAVTAFAANSSDNAPSAPTAEPQTAISEVSFRQNGTDIQQSMDGGKSWGTYTPVEETDYFTYDEFAAWLEVETANIQALVEVGEWTQDEADKTLENYKAILDGIANGQMVSKRDSSSQDLIFFSLPEMNHPETYQTYLYDGNSYTNFGPFDTEKELYNALQEYTEEQVSAGRMLPAEANALLEQYK